MSNFHRKAPVGFLLYLQVGFFSIDLIADLQSLLNFTYEFIELDESDDVFGADIHSNGTFNGMIGMLQKNKADVILADIPITSGKMPYLKPEAPIVKSSTRIK